MKWSSSALRLAAAGALLLLYFGGLGDLPLLEPDEGRYTEIPREMLSTGEYVLPHLNGVLYFEKPVLTYWLVASAIKVFGLNEFASRFWSALLGLAGLAVAYPMALRCWGRRAAYLSVLVLGTSPLYLALARLTTTDMPLTFFLSSTLFCFYVGWEVPPARWGGAVRHLAFAAAALAVLSKGLVGIVLPLGIIGAYVALTRRWHLLKTAPWLSGSLLFLAIAAPWHVCASAKDPDFAWFYFVREHFLRYLTPIHDRVEPVWFFLPVLVWGLMPWVALLPSAFADFASSLKPGLARKEANPRLFLWIWAGVVVLFFSASQSKLIPYVLPALPPLGVLAALAADRLLDRKVGWLRTTRVSTLLTLSGAALLGGLFIFAGTGRMEELTPDGTPVAAALAAGGALVVLAGISWCFFLKGDVRRWLALMALCACAFFGGIRAVAPHLQSGKSMLRIAAFVRSCLGPGDLLYCYRYYPQTLPVYARRTVGLASFQGEQAFGASKLPEAERRRRFPSDEEFREIWKSPQAVYCVTDTVSIRHLYEGGIEPWYPVIEEGQVFLMTNKPPAPGEREGHVLR